MLKIVDREREIKARIYSALTHLHLHMHNMSLHDFEDSMRTVHILRFKLYTLGYEKEKIRKETIKDNLL